MRNGQQKRMRGRNNNNNRRGQNPLTRVYESNGPDVKVRGTSAHIAEKYVQLARDAQSSGDHVAAENYLQHAEHYFRMIAAAQAQFQQGQGGGFSGQGRVEDLREGDDEDDDEPMSPGLTHPGMMRLQEQERAQQMQQQPREQPRYPDPARFNNNNEQPRYPDPQPREAPQPAESGDAPEFGGLPAFITGSQPQPGGQGNYDGNGDRDSRFRGRRRRHRFPSRSEQGGEGDAPAPAGAPTSEPTES